MKTVYKYQIPFDKLDGIQFEMPDLASILPHIEYEEHNSVTEFINFWAEVDTARAPRKRKFQVVGTGHPIPEDSRYVDTIVLRGGRIVFHLYEIF